MIARFIEATNTAAGGCNWGKFLLARFEEQEWCHASTVDGNCLLRSQGWTPDHLLVVDLATGEGAILRPSKTGAAAHDLDKHKVWVCPLFEPFLDWLYGQDLGDLAALPSLVVLEAPSEMRGYRRSGEGPGPLALAMAEKVLRLTEVATRARETFIERRSHAAEEACITAEIAAADCCRTAAPALAAALKALAERAA